MIVHIDALPAEVDEHYIVEVGVLGEIGEALRAIAWKAKPQQGFALRQLRQAIVCEVAEHAEDRDFPMKPQKIVWDLLMRSKST